VIDESSLISIWFDANCIFDASKFKATGHPNDDLTSARYDTYVRNDAPGKTLLVTIEKPDAVRQVLIDTDKPLNEQPEMFLLAPSEVKRVRFIIPSAATENEERLEYTGWGAVVYNDGPVGDLQPLRWDHITAWQDANCTIPLRVMLTDPKSMLASFYVKSEYKAAKFRGMILEENRWATVYNSQMNLSYGEVGKVTLHIKRTDDLQQLHPFQWRLVLE